MATPIEVSRFDSVLTIAFENLSLNNGVTVWVLEDFATFRAALKKMASEDHIKVLAAGNSHVERGKSNE